MSDYDIVIKLDPGQPVAGAQKVTQAVASVEATSKKAQEAIDGVAKSAASLKSINFKQAAAGAAQAFQLLNEKLKITDTAMGRTIGSAVKFASVGAQMGGPWGAAIGATISLVDDLGNAFGLKSKMITDGIDEIEAHQKKAGLAVNAATKAIEAQGAALVGLAQDMSPVNTAMRDLTSAFHGLSNAAASVPDWLVRGLGGDAWDPGKLKNQLDAINGGAAYIGGLGDLGRVGAGSAAGGAYQSGLLNQATPGDKQWFDSAELNKLTDDLVAMLEAEQAATDQAEQLGLALALKPDDDWNDLSSQIQGMQKDFEGMSRDVRQLAEVDVLKAAQNTRKWNEELEATTGYSALIGEQIKQAGTSFADTLVDAANGADVSWTSFFETLLKNLEKAIAQALVLQALTGSVTGSGTSVGGGVGGLLGLLGFASGGVISPSGSGTTDTQTVMFRKAPSETVRIHTPGQEAAYRGGGGGSPVTVQVVDQRSDRALAPSRGDHQLFVELARQNAGFLRGLTR